MNKQTNKYINKYIYTHIITICIYVCTVTCTILQLPHATWLNPSALGACLSPRLVVICAAVAAIWEVILSGSLGAMKSGTSPALVLKTLEAWEDPRHEILVYPEGPLMPCASVYRYMCVYCIINYIISYYIICVCAE